MPKDWNDGGARGRTSWDESYRVWNRGGIQPQARQIRVPSWLVKALKEVAGDPAPIDIVR